jgi:hypothetical protein
MEPNCGKSRKSKDYTAFSKASSEIPLRKQTDKRGLREKFFSFYWNVDWTTLSTV